MFSFWYWAWWDTVWFIQLYAWLFLLLIMSQIVFCLAHNGKENCHYIPFILKGVWLQWLFSFWLRIKRNFVLHKINGKKVTYTIAFFSIRKESDVLHIIYIFYIIYFLYYIFFYIIYFYTSYIIRAYSLTYSCLTRIARAILVKIPIEML